MINLILNKKNRKIYSNVMSMFNKTASIDDIHAILISLGFKIKYGCIYGKIDNDIVVDDVLDSFKVNDILHDSLSIFTYESCEELINLIKEINIGIIEKNHYYDCLYISTTYSSISYNFYYDDLNTFKIDFDNKTKELFITKKFNDGIAYKYIYMFNKYQWIEKSRIKVDI